MPRPANKRIKLPEPPSEVVDLAGVIEYLNLLNNSLVRELDDVLWNMNFISLVASWPLSTDAAFGTLKLVPLSAAPSSPVSGMLAVCDGSGWDPVADGNEHLMVYINAGWVQAA